MNADRSPLDALVRGFAPIQDPDIPDELRRPPAELLEDIVRSAHAPAHSVRRRGHRAWAFVAAAAAIVAVAIIAGGVLVGPPPVNAEPVTFRIEGGFIVASVADPAASEAELEAAFERRGFQIRIIQQPASPSFEGVVGGMGEDEKAQKNFIRTVHGEGCITQGGGDRCPIGIKIPLDFEGHAVVQIGRPAAPGERYAMAADAFAPGEMLACTDLRFMPVEDAIPVLEDLNVRPIWRTHERDSNGFPGGTKIVSIDPSELTYRYVVEASPIRDGEVFIWAQRRDYVESIQQNIARYPEAQELYEVAYQRGC